MKMFRCEMCGKITRQGEKQHKKILKTRKRTYHYLDKKGQEKTSIGSEIVKEINICEKCSNNER